MKHIVSRWSFAAFLIVSSALLAQNPRAGTDAAQQQPQIRKQSALASALGPRTSPFDPPKSNDHSFFTDSGASLDTGCIFRSSGPIIFDVNITRVVGDVNADGTLKDAAALVSSGLLSPTVKLVLPAFDVDSGAVLPPPEQPEVDVISFNGDRIGTLSGENNNWVLNSFEIPVGKVKFATRGANGNDPTPGQNEIRIDIDTANAPLGEELWCTSIDWGSMEFKAMSPIILVHGNNSNGGFFDRQGFTAALKTKHLSFDNSITMATSSRSANAARLDSLIPPIVKSFGVDSVHIIVHSKGGLDTRDYLANYQPAHNNDFKVLSFTSLSSPHDGSIGADVLVTRDIAANQVGITGRVEFVGFPDYTRQLAALLGVDAGTPDLTTGAASNFNPTNVAAISGLGIVFNTVAADADLNGNGHIDRNPDEYAELRAESVSLARVDSASQTVSQRIIDAIYQILRNTSAVTVAYHTENIGLGLTRRIATITSIPNPNPVGNDTLVTIPSGKGAGSIAFFVTNNATFTGANGRNHSSVANGGVANTVIPWIIDVEKKNGDLK